MNMLLALLLCTLITAGATGADSPAPVASEDAPTLQLTMDQPRAEDFQLAPVTETPTDETVRPDIHYVPTPQELVDAMLLMAEVKKDDLLYDLGSGDGRLVITAAKTYGARGIGIDIDPVRITEAKQNAAAAKVEDKVEFRQQDLFTSDFKDANVITLYLLEQLNRRLRPQLFAQVKPGTRIVSHAFRMGDWAPDAEKTLKVNATNYDAYLWVVPANMSGRWKVTGDRGTPGIPESVVVEQAFQKITVRAGEGGEVLGEGNLKGTDFVLTLKGAAGENVTSFAGSIEGNRIKATPSGKGGGWSAEREAGTEKPLDPGT